MSDSSSSCSSATASAESERVVPVFTAVLEQNKTMPVKHIEDLIAYRRAQVNEAAPEVEGLAVNASFFLCFPVDDIIRLGLPVNGNNIVACAVLAPDNATVMESTAVGDLVAEVSTLAAAVADINAQLEKEREGKAQIHHLLSAALALI